MSEAVLVLFFGYTHSVVAFIVNVSVEENKVNSHVGSVIVVKLAIPSKVLGTIFMKKSINLPTLPHILPSFEICAISVASIRFPSSLA